MIFILNEQVLNGTVTINNIITGIEAENFLEAVKKVKTFKSFIDGIVEITDENNNEFIFRVLQESSYKVLCVMKNEELKVL